MTLLQGCSPKIKPFCTFCSNAHPARRHATHHRIHAAAPKAASLTAHVQGRLEVQAWRPTLSPRPGQGGKAGQKLQYKFYRVTHLGLDVGWVGIVEDGDYCGHAVGHAGHHEAQAKGARAAHQPIRPFLLVVLPQPPKARLALSVRSREILTEATSNTSLEGLCNLWMAGALLMIKGRRFLGGDFGRSCFSTHHTPATCT